VFAHPTPSSLLYGTIIGLSGLLLRAYAAGYLSKQEVLTTCGPYAYTRNPLYLGSALLTVGVAVGTNSWLSSLLLCGYFAVFYSAVMYREQEDLRLRYGVLFEAYSQAVPVFLPRWSAAKLGPACQASFSIVRYKKNREYRAGIGFLLLLVVLLVVWRFRLA